MTEPPLALKMLAKPGFGLRPNPGETLRACSCEYGQISSPNRLQEAKLSKNWAKHALKLTPGPLGGLLVYIWPQKCLLVYIWPQYLTVFPKTCLQLTLSVSQWPGQI